MAFRTSLAALALSAPLSAQAGFAEFTGAAGDLAWDNGRTELELGDLNGDGHPDVVTVGDHGSPFIGTQMHGITAWLGDGAGGWTLVQTGEFGYGGLALGDADGDGRVDVGYGVHHDYAGTDFGDQLLEVALGDGTGAGWTPWDDGLATSGETWGMFGCDFGDVDGDGDLDLGSISFGCCAGVHVYRSEGDGTWTPSFGFLGGNSDMVFEFADFDGNGHLDFLAGHSDGDVHLGDGTGSFAPASGNLPTTWPIGASAGDVDGDGRDEVAWVDGGGLEVWSWTPGNVWVSRTGNLPAGGSFEATDLADMDGDGHAELVAFGEGSLVVAAWSAGDAWTVAAQASTAGTGDLGHEALRAGVDLDHNGFADVALVQEESGGGPFSQTKNRLVLLRETTVPTALEPRLVAPGPDRRWIGGQARFVDWLCAVPAGETATVDLELSWTGADGPWTLLAADLPNGGRHQLVVPAGVDSEECRLRLTARTATGESVAVGPAFAVDAPPAVAPYGCGVNPPGSLTVVAGAPASGGSATFALDDTLGTSPSPATALVLLSLAPDPNAPCGTQLPGLGLDGPTGELLVSLAPPDPVLLLPAAAPWTTPGKPVLATLAVPPLPGLVGLELHAQGALVAPGSSKVTAALRLEVGQG